MGFLRLLATLPFAWRVEVEAANELGDAGQWKQWLVSGAPLAVGKQIYAQLTEALLGSNVLWVEGRGID